MAMPQWNKAYRWELTEESTNLDSLSFPLPAPLRNLSTTLTKAGLTNTNHKRREFDGVLYVSRPALFGNDMSGSLATCYVGG